MARRAPPAELEPFILDVEPFISENDAREQRRMKGSHWPPKQKTTGIFITIAAFFLVYVVAIILTQTGPSTADTETLVEPKHAAPEEIKEEENTALLEIQNSTLGFAKIFSLRIPGTVDDYDTILRAADLTDLSLEFVNAGDQPLQRASKRTQQDTSSFPRGTWGVHKHALERVVSEDLTTVLILEDNADWDIRYKKLLTDTAIAFQAMTQPLKGEDGRFADSTYPIVLDPNAQTDGWGLDLLPHFQHANSTPYGDNWDILWLGHCGMRRPRIHLGEEWEQVAQTTPKGFVYHKDLSVPEPHYVSRKDETDRSFPKFFSNHTRIWQHVMDGSCTTAYAVTQHGARNILKQLSEEASDVTFDKLLLRVCEGWGINARSTCLTVEPTLFGQHWPAGAAYEGSKAYTNDIRWSARLNIGKLAAGAGKSEYLDDYPDWTAYLRNGTSNYLRLGRRLVRWW